jgi:PAS domain S-box-containing protein
LVTALLLAAILAAALQLDRSLRANARGHQDLLRSENHFRALAENLPDVVVRLDQSGRHLYASPSVVQLHGRSAASLLGTSFTDLGMPERARAEWALALHGAVNLGRTERLDFSHEGPQGLRHWEALVVREPPVTDEEATVLVISRDVTDRYAALQQLRDSEQRLRLALAAANQGLYDLDLRTGQTVVSPEYAQMLGYDAKEFTESHAAWRARLHPDDQAAAFRAYDDYLAGRSTEYRVEFRQRTKDGRWLWTLSLGKVQERGPSGQPLRLLGTHTDITAMRQAQAELLQSELRFRLAASFG